MKEPAKKEEIITIAVDPGNPVRPQNAKLTKKRRAEFLKEFAKDFNITRACVRIGVSRESIMKLKQNDEKFKKAFESVKDAYLDSVESACYSVALRPTREGFNDRKLLLQSNRSETYAPQLKINQTVKIDARIVNANIGDLLQRFLPSEADIKEIK